MALCLAACTENESVRQYGGTMRVDVPPGRKIVTVTWKDHDIWYLTRSQEDWLFRLPGTTTLAVTNPLLWTAPEAPNLAYRLRLWVGLRVAGGLEFSIGAVDIDFGGAR